jgi:hypothetical protein
MRSGEERIAQEVKGGGLRSEKLDENIKGCGWASMVGDQEREKAEKKRTGEAETGDRCG